MYKARQYLSKCTLLNLYYAYIYSYMTYCIEIWGSATQSHLNCLFLHQKIYIRIMNYSHYLAHGDKRIPAHFSILWRFTLLRKYIIIELAR